MPWTKVADATNSAEVGGICWANNLLWVFDSAGLFWSYDGSAFTARATPPADVASSITGANQLLAMNNGTLVLIGNYRYIPVLTYHPNTDTWVQGTEYPNPNSCRICNFATDGNVIYGAMTDQSAAFYDGSTGLTYCAIYNPTTDVWDLNSLPHFPPFPGTDFTSGLGWGSFHYVPATAGSHASLVYVNGWWDQNAPQGETYVLDLTTLGDWAGVSPQDDPREDQGAGTSGIAGVFELLVVAGGDDVAIDSKASVEVYDILNDAWASVADLPVGLDYPAITIGGGYVWVYGGWSDDSNAPFFGDQTAIYRMPYSDFPNHGLLPQPEPPQPATTQLQLNTAVLDTPGYLNVNVSNVPAGELISFRLDVDDVAHQIDTAFADENGNLNFHDVLVSTDLVNATHHTLYANNATVGSDSADFTVDNNQPQEADVSQPVAPVLIPRLGVQRWYFQDPTGNNPDHQIFPRNPEKYSTPFADKVLNYDFSADHTNGQPITFEGKPKPVEWSFEGKLFTKAEEAQFVYWYTRPYRLYIVDHENRAYTVYLKGLDIQPAQTLSHMEKRTYKITATLYGPPVQLH